MMQSQNKMKLNEIISEKLAAVGKLQHVVDGVNECTQSQTEREIVYICGPSVAALTTTVMRMARVKSMDSKDTWSRGRERSLKLTISSLMKSYTSKASKWSTW